MVLACTADRNHVESPKWYLLLLGLAVTVYFHWDALSWSYFFSAPFWKTVGIYMGIGLAYSLVEFLFQVRKESQEWSREWNTFKSNEKRAQEERQEVSQGQRSSPARRFSDDSGETLSQEERFIADVKRGMFCERDRLIRVGLDPQRALIPVVNRKELTAGIACWTLFWPAYAVSLMLGDVLTAICRSVGDVFIFLSSGLIRRFFAKTFTP